MPITARTRDTIVKTMQSDIDSLQTAFDSTSGPVKDVVIDPVAQQIATFEETLAYASKLRAIDSAAELLEEDLDALGADYGLVRGQGNFAKGTVLFERSSAPITDIVIPAGTLVTSTNGNLSYYTLASVTMYASLATVYYNSSRNKYGVLARVSATNAGSDWNVSAGKITGISGVITGIDGCYNPNAMAGGTDIETNTDYAVRISTVMQGTDRSSTGGTSREVLSFDPTIKGVFVSQGADKFLTRTSTALPRDIYITGFSTDTITEVFTGGVSSYLFTEQPVVSIVGVYDYATGNPFVYGSDYTLLKDSSELRGSTRGLDSILFLTGTPTATMLVTYDKNITVSDLQGYFDSPDRNLLGTDTLVREGEPIRMYVTIKMVALPGYDVTELRTEVSNLLLSEINTYQFGDGKTLIYAEPYRLDILNSVEGVSSLLFTQFSTMQASMTLEQFYLEKNEYLYLETSNILWA